MLSGQHREFAFPGSRASARARAFSISTSPNLSGPPEGGARPAPRMAGAGGLERTQVIAVYKRRRGRVVDHGDTPGLLARSA